MQSRELFRTVLLQRLSATLWRALRACIYRHGVHLVMTNELGLQLERLSISLSQHLAAQPYNDALAGLDGELPTSGSLAYIYCPKYVYIVLVLSDLDPG